MPTSWNLRVIGEGALVADDGITSNLPAKSKRFGVLVFLAIPVAGRRVRRDEILAMFWPELDSVRARNALRSTLHQVRQTLGVDAIVGSGEEEIALNRSFIHVDFFELSRALDSGDALPWLRTAVSAAIASAFGSPPTFARALIDGAGPGPVDSRPQAAVNEARRQPTMTPERWRRMFQPSDEAIQPR